MSKQLISIKNDTLIFGTPTETEKQKLKGFEAFGNTYNVKSYNEATRLEMNDSVIIETVPGTQVSDFKYENTSASFEIFGETSTQITLKLKEKTDYKVIIDGVNTGNINSGSSGKIIFSADLKNSTSVVSVECI